ncbi:putative NRPS-like protein biosynthetic cluster [Diaporthe australafricana]|uniref:NRPS-like protein biosynthetic cluster n=1 Tax=Diaporthe australafricana TaxID=127596 RepID=A0ABR3W2U8_9PEZI
MKYNILPSSGHPVQRKPAFKPADIDLKRASSSAAIRTIPELIEYNAKVNPNALYCVQALKSRDGQTRNVSQVSMRELRDAIWRCSNDLRECLIGLDDSTTGTSDLVQVKPDPVAILMDSDVGLLIHLFSLIALGVPAILLSPRLNPASIQHLLTTLKAQAVLTSPRHVDTINAAFETTRLEYGRGGTKIQVAKPFTDYLSGSREDKAIPADATICGPRHFLGDSDKNVIILHTSGTTGFPKPVHQPHKMLLGYACCHRRTEAEDVEGLNLSMLPLYHGFGLVVACLALGTGKPILLPPPHEVSTARSSVKLLHDYKAKSFTTVPFILEEISRLPDDEGIAHLTALQYVACGGGPLGVAAGDHLVKKGVRLLNHFGSTETGPLGPFMVPSKGYDWHYWPLRSDVDVKIEPSGIDETSGQQHYQLSVTPFGWSEPFVLQDRFEKDSWSETPAFRAVGREDDLLVLINGLKVQPKILESTVSNSDLVTSALAFGEGEFEIGLLLEPTQPPEDIQKFKLSVWPLVQEACRKMDSHAQISSMANLVVLGRGESLPRSDKGSVLRKEAYRQYEERIRQVYSSQSVEESTETVLGPGADRLEAVLDVLIREELRIPKSLEPDDDIFDWGVDSLQVVRIKRGLIAIVNESQDLLPKEKVTADLVYRNPTINKLCQALRQNTSTNIHEEETLMNDYISRFSLPQEQKGFRVLLTGSSGSLGSYLLSHLTSLPHVAEVICFVRGPSHSNISTVPLTEQRIEAAEEKGATITSDKRAKVAVVEGDPATAQFGLPSDSYEELCSKVTHIMHAAWPVDFQRPLESFESQFGFLQNLLQLARDAHIRRPLLKPRLLFVSSIAVVGQYPTIHGSNIVPEEAITDPQCASSLGYGKAKLVCERILAKAPEDWASEMEVSSVRTGQLSGAEGSGYWNPKEHFPALIKMSHEAGVFPQLKGTLSWLPVNVAAAAMSDLLLSSEPMDVIYHMENPVRQDWATVMNQIAEELGHQVSCFIEFKEWTRLVRRSSSTGRDSGIEMLMDFLEKEFQHMSDSSIVLDTWKTRRVSKTLRDTTSVPVDTITKYTGAWKKAGLIL